MNFFAPPSAPVGQARRAAQRPQALLVREPSMGTMELRVRAVAIPLSRPTRMSTRNLDERQYLLVEVRSPDGIGEGYCYAGTRGGSLLAAGVTELLQPGVREMDGESIADRWEVMGLE